MKMGRYPSVRPALPDPDANLVGMGFVSRRALSLGGFVREAKDLAHHVAPHIRLQREGLPEASQLNAPDLSQSRTELLQRAGSLGG